MNVLRNARSMPLDREVIVRFVMGGQQLSAVARAAAVWPARCPHTQVLTSDAVKHQSAQAHASAAG
jgi:hypothetical protein